MNAFRDLPRLRDDTWWTIYVVIFAMFALTRFSLLHVLLILAWGLVGLVTLIQWDRRHRKATAGKWRPRLFPLVYLVALIGLLCLPLGRVVMFAIVGVWILTYLILTRRPAVTTVEAEVSAQPGAEA